MALLVPCSSTRGNSSDAVDQFPLRHKPGTSLYPTISGRTELIKDVPIPYSEAKIRVRSEPSNFRITMKGSPIAHFLAGLLVFKIRPRQNKMLRKK